MNDHDDELERRLRDALEAEAGGIEPDDRLEQIRAAARAAGVGRQRPRWFAPAAAAAAVAAIGGGAWGIAQGTASQQQPLPGVSTSSSLPDLPTNRTSPAPSRTTAPAPNGTTTGPAPSGTASSAPAPSGTTSSAPAPTGTPSSGVPVPRTLPVYFVGSTGGGGDGLYRQFLHGTADGPTDAAAARAALALAMAPGAAVPGQHYLTPWAGTTVTEVQVGGNRIRVTLSGPGSAGGLSAAQTRLAVQQLVWTAQAAVGRGTIPVVFSVADGSTQLFGSYSTGTTYNRPGESFQDLAPIWVTSPTPGQRLPTGHPVVVEGQSCVFEATTSWTLRRGSAVVRSGTAVASSACPARGTWRVPLGVLPAGGYTFEMSALSPRDGTVTARTSSSFTVQ